MHRVDTECPSVYYVHNWIAAERMRLDVSHAIEFIETPTFTRQIQGIATDIIYLILAYPKSMKESLTPAEKATLRTLTHQLKGEASQ